MAGTRFVAVAHEPKLAGLARRLGQVSVPSHATAGVLEGAIRHALGHGPSHPPRWRPRWPAPSASFGMLELLLSGGVGRAPSTSAVSTCRTGPAAGEDALMTDVSIGRRLAPVDLTRAMRPQLTVMSGQLVAGVGNLLFAVVMAHVLRPGEYSDVVSFLALFVLLHVPGVALSAAGALDPDRLDRLRPRVVGVGLAVGAALVVGAPVISGVLGLPTDSSCCSASPPRKPAC